MSDVRYKLHPISAFLNFIKGLKELIFPFIIIFGVNLFRGGGESVADRGWQGLIPVLIAGVVLIFMLVSGLIKWRRFVYWFEEGELRIEYGLFVKKKRYIPFERIQSLNYTEGIFHRPFGLVKVKVETAGTGKVGQADVELTAISREDAERIEKKMEYAKHHSREPFPEADNEVGEETETSAKTVKTIYRMSMKELIILATTSGGIGVVISAVAVFLSQFSDLIPYDAVYQEVMLFLRFGYLIVALAIFLILLLAWVISVILAIFANYQFTISADEDHIYISRGLLEKKKVSVPFKRIQGIQISQNPLREWFGYAAVTVESAGGTFGDKDEKIRLFPLAKKSAILPILGDLFPDMEWEPVMKKAPKRSLHFFYRLDFFWMIPVVGLISYFFYPYGLMSLLIFPAVILFAIWQHRTVGYALTGKQLTMEFRTVSKHAFFMVKKRIQAIEVTQSYFQRRKDLASIQATIKSGMLGATARIDHMERDDASRVLAWYEPSNSKTTDQ
ncbi:PH domain-containing protein [Planomicrobium sp. CPCC 101110]|uniref:PH domain-containing protein n=1 Tax=Planomicrobium sp. CPCC 101110 TaxID=2599619 RepID=UPI0011B78D68|nr:PH domain-containing protein [Planomicrobium sp. CPCC 101110]TWT24615.1 PH domain-containing protein [Planomicrobium sp. CPCC 101110]